MQPQTIILPSLCLTVVFEFFNLRVSHFFLHTHRRLSDPKILKFDSLDQWFLKWAIENWRGRYGGRCALKIMLGFIFKCPQTLYLSLKIWFCHEVSIDTISNCLITGIIEGNPEPEVYETINEEKNIVEEQMTEEHLSDEMILNLVSLILILVLITVRNPKKIILLQDVERSIQNLEDFAYQELNDLTTKMWKSSL